MTNYFTKETLGCPNCKCKMGVEVVPTMSGWATIHVCPVCGRHYGVPSFSDRQKDLHPVIPTYFK